MMTTSYGVDSGLAILWILHVLGMIAVSIGFLFLVILATKKLHEKQLKMWGMYLLIGGVILCALTLIFLPVHRVQSGNMMWQGTTKSVQQGMPVNGMMPGMRHMMNNGMMMDNDMMNDSSNPMGMSMEDMSMMLQGKTGDDFDKAFLEGMIPHHQGAIEMAKAALQSAGHQEIKQMATDIISAQQKEIDMMKQWENAWGYTK